MPKRKMKNVRARQERKVYKAMETIFLLGNSEQREAIKPLMMNAAKDVHPSHEVRYSDSSVYDLRCVHCSATDHVLGGLGNLALPCPRPRKLRRAA